MPQLSAALIDEVRIHLTERWQNDAIYQRYANAPTQYEGPSSIRSFMGCQFLTILLKIGT